MTNLVVPTQQRQVAVLIKKTWDAIVADWQLDNPGKPNTPTKIYYLHPTIPGFMLQAVNGKRKVTWTWVLRYSLLGQPKGKTLGSAYELSPDAAAKMAAQFRIAADAGIDPGADKQARRAAAEHTFATHLDDFFKAPAQQGIKPSSMERLQRHLKVTWRHLHNMPVADIRKADIKPTLDAIKTPHASDCARARLSTYCAWLIEQELLEHNPVSDIPRKVSRAAGNAERERALSPAELQLVLKHSRAHRSVEYSQMIELLVLTGQRREEIAGLLWSEVEKIEDAQAAMIRLPGSRTKNGKEHLVPLSRQARAILLSIPRVGDRVFHKLINNSAFSEGKLALDRAIAADQAIEAWRVHDLRRTAVTGMSELGIRDAVVEAIVNHQSGLSKAGVAGTYNRAKYLAERRVGLQQWADEVKPDNVVAFQAAA